MLSWLQANQCELISDAVRSETASEYSRQCRDTISTEQALKLQWIFTTLTDL